MNKVINIITIYYFAFLLLFLYYINGFLKYSNFALFFDNFMQNRSPSASLNSQQLLSERWVWCVPLSLY